MSHFLFKVIVFAFLFSTITGSDNIPHSSLDSSPIVHTNNGAIRGRVVKAANGRYAQEFLNIPYAQPPIKLRRFRSPQPIANWTGVRDGTRLGYACWQSEGELTQYFTKLLFQLDPDRSTFSEDCLTINVYAPHYLVASKSRDSKLPILVWIHGGGFQWGSNNIPLYNGSILATEIDAIVVFINYRLGAFGFLTLDGIDGVGGNQGLLDQALAIKWVRDNARHFGGDPEQITLTGESSGAASVQYHSFSNVTRNLFARSIMQSGSATSYWAYHTPEKARHWSRAYVVAAGCGNQGDDRKLFECFQSKTASQIAVETFNEIRRGAELRVLAPTTDGTFLTKSPSECLQSGDFKRAPAIVGTVAEESLCWYDGYLSAASDSSKGLTKETYDAFLERVLFFADEEARNAINFAYRNWSIPNDDDLASRVERLRVLIAISDDIDMNNGLMETLQAYLKANVSIYRYRFDEVSSVPMWNNHSYSGAVHNDQLPFLLGHVLDPKFGYSKVDIDFARKLLRMVGNFLRTGDPNFPAVASNETWKPYSGNLEYFTLDSQRYGQTSFGPEQWRVDFWRRAAPYFVGLEKRNALESTHKQKSEICFSRLIVHVLSGLLLLLVALFVFMQFRTIRRQSESESSGRACV